MRLVVGLGNPGSRYEGSRHNAGFKLVEALSRKFGGEFKKRQFYSLLCPIEIAGEEVVLAKPLTYMNRSGYAVRALVDWYGLVTGDFIVVYDDMDLELGRIRLRPKGGSGGHNGVKSIIDLLGTEEFPRLRIGIGRPEPSMDPAEYVLSVFTREEFEEFYKAIGVACDAIQTWVEEGLDAAMNRYNG